MSTTTIHDVHLSLNLTETDLQITSSDQALQVGDPYLDHMFDAQQALRSVRFIFPEYAGDYRVELRPIRAQPQGQVLLDAHPVLAPYTELEAELHFTPTNETAKPKPPIGVTIRTRPLGGGGDGGR